MEKRWLRPLPRNRGIGTCPPSATDWARESVLGPSSGAEIERDTYSLPDVWPVRFQPAPISMPCDTTRKSPRRAEWRSPRGRRVS
jgi:hypothetical protein